MQLPSSVLKKASAVIASLCLGVFSFFPAVAIAEETTAASTSTSAGQPQQPTPPPAPSKPEAPKGPTTPTGPTKPTGPEASTYTYNETTGLWENEHYTWDPNTKQTAPKQPQDYSYNPQTGAWDTKEWQYNPTTGTYEEHITSQSKAPAGANANSQSNGNPLQSASSVKNTGPNSSNEVDNNDQSNGVFNSFYDASISNNIDSHATTGDAGVSSNTQAGGALTGSAEVVANVINLMQSSWGSLGQNMFTFISDIAGNVVGDLLLDPLQLSKTNNTSLNNEGNTSVTVNSSGNAKIANDINLDAQTGDASVAGNTSAGSATSGNANAVANVVNMVNSSVASGQSFMGMLNIYGDFEGDILLPDGFLESLLASNANNQLTQGRTQNIDVATTTNQDIINNIQTNANSGNATVANNTSAGNASSGDSLTNVTVFNMTGRQVVGKNSLLVFVNVMGQWVGMIMDAPGSTAAALGGGVTQNSLDNANFALTETTNQQIENNINVNAQSGDASVTNNTLAGDATTGDATASVNLANILNSNLSLSDWFGVLFINVFGTWNGSFGINTAAGNPILPNSPGQSGDGTTPNAQVLAFVPGGTSTKTWTVTTSQAYNFASTGQPATTQDQQQAVAAATTESNGPSGGRYAAPQQSGQVPQANKWLLPILGSGLAGLAMLGGEQVSNARKRRQRARKSFSRPQVVAPSGATQNS